MTEDWFRGPAWDEAARAAFETRLARARPANRQQYLRIKGVHLRMAGNDVGARELLERAADHPGGYVHQTVAAWETLADISAECGERAQAESLYRRILTEQPDGNGTTSSVQISLAELLLDTGRPEDRDEALALLQGWLDRPVMKLDSELFRWHLALIRVAQATGDQGMVRRAAATALDLAERGPQLARHPDAGLVRTDAATLEMLRRLAA